MKSGLSVGMESTVTFFVDEGMAATFEGRTVHKLLSTFLLVYYAELAARNLIEPYLQEGEDAAGAGICLNHIAPTTIGETARVTAILSEIHEKRLVCKIEGTNSKGSICNGTQTQILIEKGSLN
ncbi:MAG: thioesterase [Bacteroidetes bacterium]|nr:thioesterase [Bacteroidota bacterium]MCL5267776.1 thioesterase [Bacteroidota bacterium]